MFQLAAALIALKLTRSDLLHLTILGEMCLLKSFYCLLIASICCILRLSVKYAQKGNLCRILAEHSL